MKRNFNYIVPIYNKEDVLPLTLEGIERSATSNSRIILIVDGCTDNSEKIVDDYIKNSSNQVLKINMPNVHMLLSVNAGLEKVREGFSVIMQDDIILEDVDMERKVLELYKEQRNLGMISFRYGSNVKPMRFLNKLRGFSFQSMIEEVDFIKGPDDAADYLEGEYGKFYPRMSAINGPNIIPWELLSVNGLFDPNLAPFGFDDPEYCLRALKLGFINGLFPVKYRSDIEWGGTRRSESFINYSAKIHKRNQIYIYNKHREFLLDYLRSNKLFDDITNS